MYSARTIKNLLFLVRFSVVNSRDTVLTRTVCVKWSICSGQAPCWPGGNYKGSGPGESAESSTLVALFSHSCPSLYNYTWSGKLSHISFRNLIRKLVDISRLIISPNYSMYPYIPVTTYIYYYIPVSL